MINSKTPVESTVPLSSRDVSGFSVAPSPKRKFDTINSLTSWQRFMFSPPGKRENRPTQIFPILIQDEGNLHHCAVPAQAGLTRRAYEPVRIGWKAASFISEQTPLRASRLFPSGSP